METTIDCVKEHAYRLDEFLFGYKQAAKGGKRTTMERMVDSARTRQNKIMFLVLYLSPKDYHRFHSPATFTASYRRHIAGYLEPVDPRYVAGHRDVYASNERVNVLGDWAHGFLAVSFVGATNVGSIKLHFDEDLRTNVSRPKPPYVSDKSYAALSESDSAFWGYPVRRKSRGVDEEEAFEIDRYLAEFDIKDVVASEDAKSAFVYGAPQENRLPFNALNGFKERLPEETDQAGQKNMELLSKLESPGSAYQTNKTYTVTPTGVFLRKGEELGMFEMGSSIVLLFECPKEMEVVKGEGDVVKYGERISQLNK